MARPKAAHDIAPSVRASFLEALRLIKKQKGLTFSQIIAQMLLEDPYKTLQCVAKFSVTEKKVEHAGSVSHKHSGVEATRNFLEGLDTVSGIGTLPEHVEDKSVLPTPVRTEPTRH